MENETQPSKSTKVLKWVFVGVGILTLCMGLLSGVATMGGDDSPAATTYEESPF